MLHLVVTSFKNVSRIKQILLYCNNLLYNYIYYISSNVSEVSFMLNTKKSMSSHRNRPNESNEATPVTRNPLEDIEFLLNLLQKVCRAFYSILIAFNINLLGF